MKYLAGKAVSALLLFPLSPAAPWTLAASGADAPAGFRGVSVEASGMRRLRQVPGPYQGKAGFEAAVRRAHDGLVLSGSKGEAAEGPVTLRLTADAPLGSRGGITFWIRLDRAYRSSATSVPAEEKLVEFGGLMKSAFVSRSSQVEIRSRWGRTSKRVQFPGLPGPGWIHLAYRWDADAGLLEGFLNGTPLQQPADRREAWTVRGGSEGALHVGRFAVSGLRVSPEPFSDDELRTEVSQLYRGSLDYLIGARELGPFEAESRKGEILYENSLADARSVLGWVVEGAAAQVEFADGWMVMSSRPGDWKWPEGHMVHWCDVDFPGSFIAEWEMQLLDKGGLCIVFFAAKGRRGEDLFDPALGPRKAHFERYTKGDINCYHISYFAGTRATANMRKNHGFHLVTNGPVGIRYGSTGVHKVVLMKDGPRISLGVVSPGEDGGRKIIEFLDDGRTYGPRLGGGKIGLRQMRPTRARYRNFRVYAVK